MYKIFFSFLGIVIFPLGIYALETGNMEDLSISLERIIEIDKQIKQKPTVTIAESLIREKNELMKTSKILYKNLEVRSMSGATLDLSKSYKLELQKYALSCEISALRAILTNIKKRYVSEESIIKKLPHNPLAYSGGVWGDPDREFVGSYYASQRLRTGYGVYEAPLSRYLDTLSIRNEYSNTTLSGVTASGQLTRILTSLHEGRHVLLWGDWCTDPLFEDGILSSTDSFLLRYFDIPARNTCTRSIEERRYMWTTQSGKVIYGLSGEHAFVLLGYYGSVESPTHIIVWDTDTGKHIYAISEWMKKWGEMEYRMLIVGEKK